LIGRGVVEPFYLIEEDKGEGAGSPGNVSAEHKNNTEFPHGVQKAQDDSGQQGTSGERDEYGANHTNIASPEKTRGVKQRSVYGSEARDNGLNCKGQTVNHGTDHKAGK